MTLPDKYVSIDIETTSLDHRTGQMIEFAAVIDHLERPMAMGQLPVFRKLILPAGTGVIYGTPFALAMNAQILYEIDREMKQPTPESCSAKELPHLFRNWLDSQGFGHDHPSIAGKNFGGFDSHFLKNECAFFEVVKPIHRYLDPGMLFWDRKVDGCALPDTATCMKRAGMDPTVKHRATDDAKAICQLLRFGVNLGTKSSRILIDDS